MAGSFLRTCVRARRYGTAIPRLRTSRIWARCRVACRERVARACLPQYSSLNSPQKMPLWCWTCGREGYGGRETGSVYGAHRLLSGRSQTVCSINDSCAPRVVHGFTPMSFAVPPLLQLFSEMKNLSTRRSPCEARPLFRPERGLSNRQSAHTKHRCVQRLVCAHTQHGQRMSSLRDL